MKTIQFFLLIVIMLLCNLSFVSAADLGDVNSDGSINIIDALLVAQYSVGMPGDSSLADVDGNGSVTIVDALLIAQYSVNLITDFPAGVLSVSLMNKYYSPYEFTAVPINPGYVLPLDVVELNNFNTFNSLFGIEKAVPLLSQNGFAVMEYPFNVSDDIFKCYEELQGKHIPLFITSDIILHLYHIIFNESLKNIEETYFIGDIKVLTNALLTESINQYHQFTADILKEASLKNIAFLAVALKLIDPTAAVPAIVEEPVAKELDQINAHSGYTASNIFIYEEDYSQYVPRGHYTECEALSNYFKTLMWYGRMAFLIKGAQNCGSSGAALISVYDAKIQTIQASLLAASLNTVQTDDNRKGRAIWDRMYAVTSFFVGMADDLTPYDYTNVIKKVYGNAFIPSDLLDEAKFFDFKVALSQLRSPEIFGGTGNATIVPPVTSEKLDEILDKTKGMRFMGQRFVPDSYIFQNLVSPLVTDYTGSNSKIPFSYGMTLIGPQRSYPRGLDLMAVFGSNLALKILKSEGDTDFTNYMTRFTDLKKKFSDITVSEWNQNLYWSWLYSLKALLSEFGTGYPAFMQTEAWQKKELNTVLASWSELRHDTILYAKQSTTPVEASMPPSYGYVEPVPELYGRLYALSQMMRNGLAELKVMNPDTDSHLTTLETVLKTLISISTKELKNETLSTSDYFFINKGFITTLNEKFIKGLTNRDILKTTLVADVHTNANENLVVEEGVGYVDLIITAYPASDNTIVLSAGPVLSHYEFKQPMANRLTNEAWRSIISTSAKPEQAPWYKTIMQ